MAKHHNVQDNTIRSNVGGVGNVVKWFMVKRQTQCLKIIMILATFIE